MVSLDKYDLLSDVIHSSPAVVFTGFPAATLVAWR